MSREVALYPTKYSKCFDLFYIQVEQYSGQRDLGDFKSYLNKMVEQKDEKVESEEEKVPEKKPDDEALVSLEMKTSYPCVVSK
jgi:hypothetical protein